MKVVKILSFFLRFFYALMSDAEPRNILRDDFYYLSDQTISKFKMFQGFDPYFLFSGKRLEQAYLIWQQTPQPMLSSIIQANGFHLPENFYSNNGSSMVLRMIQHFDKLSDL